MNLTDRGQCVCAHGVGVGGNVGVIRIIRAPNEVLMHCVRQV